MPSPLARRTYTKFSGRVYILIQNDMLIVLRHGLSMIETSVCWKADLGHLTLKLGQFCRKMDLVQLIHITPYFEQLNSRSLFHDDVLSTHRIRGISVPGKNSGYRDLGMRIYY